MAVEIGPVECVARVVVSGAIEGAGDLIKSYGSYEFQPEIFKIRYLYVGRLGVWQCDGWTVSGRRRLKNGDLGSESYECVGHGEYGVLNDKPGERPAWISAMIDSYRPTSTPDAVGDLTVEDF